jgi:hypothetical protein
MSRIAFLPASLLVAVGMACAQTGSWTVMGEGGTVRVSPSGAVFEYQIQPKRFAAAVRPTPGGIANISSIRFRVRADHETAITVLLSERKPGGNYSTMIWAPANEWLQVELSPADFSLNTGASDPPDPDARLDLDQVEGIGIFDFAEFIASAPPNPNMVMERSSGAHTLAIENFELRTSSVAAPEALVLDRFDRGFLQWMTMGGMKLKLAATSPLGGPALQASYEPADGQIAVLMRLFPNRDLSAASRIAFDIASERETTLVVALEQRKSGADQPSRFNLTIFPPGGRKVFQVNLNLADFDVDVNSARGKLDPALLKSISFADVSAMAGGDASPNTIWIGNLRAIAK